jgi:hypothetical protein
MQSIEDVPVETAGHAKFVTLQIAPVHTEATTAESVVVSITDTTETVELRKQLETAQKEQRQLVEELGAANTRLSRTNDELQEANEELQGANEELLLAQEELQATNEEFEATNEELQATNEELETNNEELQATNEELEATNEELTSRTSELQEMTNTLAVERARLADMVNVAPVSMAVLRGPTLRVEAANASAVAMLGGDAVGRNFEEVCTSDGLRAVHDGARRAYDGNERWTSDGSSPAARSDPRQIFAAVPTHDANGNVTGVVVYGYEMP